MNATDQFGEDKNTNMGSIRQANFEQQTSATSLKNHYVLVDEILQISTKDLLEYKKESDALRQELTSMKQHVINFNEETTNILTPQIDEGLRNLSVSITAQKDQNSKLQIQMTELKMEIGQIQSLIITCMQKVASMENHVGHYS